MMKSLTVTQVIVFTRANSVYFNILVDGFYFQEIIEFQPLLRRHAGSYSCEAKNFLGTSSPIVVDLDVKCESTECKCQMSSFRNDTDPPVLVC